MRNDTKSNYTLAEALASGASPADSASVDHATASSASFFIQASAATSLDVIVQYSDDDIVWVDEPDAEAGNDTAIAQLVAPGTAVLHVPNPRGRYSRISATGTGTLSAVSVLGPLRHISV